MEMIFPLEFIPHKVAIKTVKAHEFEVM